MSSQASSSSSRLPTKLNQPSTSSPRTAESSRRRLGTLISSFNPLSSPARSFGPSQIGDDEGRQTRRVEQPAPRSGKNLLWSWLTPTKSTRQEQDVEGDEWDEGCFVDALSELSISSPAHQRPSRDTQCYVDDLPDEVLLAILSCLPPTPAQLAPIGRVSKRFHQLSQSPVLWQRILHSTPTLCLHAGRAARFRPITCPPPGTWVKNDWRPSSSASLPSFDPCSTSPLDVHLPTLYRTHLSLFERLHSTEETAPNNIQTLNAHTDSVYIAHLAHPWLFTGSRDRSVRIWRLDQQGKAEVIYVLENAHKGSVLSLDVEMDVRTGKGMMVTTSSDQTARVWSLDLHSKDGETVSKLGSLTGHGGGVLDAKLASDIIVTCSKDTTLKVYDRKSLILLRTLTGHSGPVNCLALPDTSVKQVVSASGDGNWIIWDLETGEQVRRGESNGRGLACVEWKGDHIITGSNDQLLQLYTATTGALIRTFEGHADLVRSISLHEPSGIIVTGSYDSTVRLWDMFSGRYLRTLELGHTSLIFCVKLQGHRLITASHDHTAVITSFGLDLPYADFLV